MRSWKSRLQSFYIIEAGKFCCTFFSPQSNNFYFIIDAIPINIAYGKEKNLTANATTLAEWTINLEDVYRLDKIEIELTATAEGQAFSIFFGYY